VTLDRTFYSLLYKQEVVAATKMTELSRPINFCPVRLAVVLSELMLCSGSASGPGTLPL
jgi:hypothetical protein